MMVMALMVVVALMIKGTASLLMYRLCWLLLFPTSSGQGSLRRHQREGDKGGGGELPCMSPHDEQDDSILEDGRGEDGLPRDEGDERVWVWSRQ